MATISLGSGPVTDVMFLFSSDVCGGGSRAMLAPTATVSRCGSLS